MNHISIFYSSCAANKVMKGFVLVFFFYKASQLFHATDFFFFRLDKTCKALVPLERFMNISQYKLLHRFSGNCIASKMERFVFFPPSFYSKKCKGNVAAF